MEKLEAVVLGGRVAGVRIGRGNGWVEVLLVSGEEVMVRIEGSGDWTRRLMRFFKESLVLA